jgi:hypothetical protein
MARPTAHIYVDGFNLYNGLKRRAEKKGVPEIEYRWLDLVKLARTLLPHADILRVFYFTSRIKRTLDNPGAADRQEIFLRALERMPEIEIVHGTFRSIRVRGKVVDDRERLETVRSYREKRSDVNLASYLLRDVYERRCQAAGIVSSDSDLVYPVELAHKKLPHGVTILNPNVTGCHHLSLVAREVVIPEAVFKSCLLPDVFQDARGGDVRRPHGW